MLHHATLHDIILCPCAPSAEGSSGESGGLPTQADALSFGERDATQKGGESGPTISAIADARSGLVCLAAVGASGVVQMER